MPFPNHPEKHRGEPVVTPEAAGEYRRERVGDDPCDPPEAVVLCYSRTLFEYLTESRPTRAVDHYYGELHRFEGTDGRVGVLGEFGIGAPTTAMLVEDLVADGVGAFLSVGMAGCLDADVGMGEFVVPDGAVRDEGTSHHYVGPDHDAEPSAALFETTTGVLAERDEPFHVGPTWTTDAIYRETVAEVERYAAEGVLTVEMEASAVFAVAAHRGVDAAAMFVVSDYLGPDDWEPRFRETGAAKRRLGDVAVAVLDASLGRVEGSANPN